MSHFTYKDAVNISSLGQGDLLSRSDDLMKTIKNVHPYFSRDDYAYFLTLTQSCDLVRRNGSKCKAKYISIAAVRSLESVLLREFGTSGNSEIEKKAGVFDRKMENRISDFLKRLLNNNIPEYFYLHQDLSKGLSEPYVATLRVSIALKADLHYEECLASKILDLTDNFQSKLGWLVGNLYSRVGTVDWIPDNLSAKEFNVLVKDTLQSQFVFVDNLKETEKALVEKVGSEGYNEMSGDAILKEISGIKLPRKKDVALKRLTELITESNFLREGADISKLITRLGNDAELTSLLK